MKTRTGFVSNSSSSSFIIALPSHPKSVEQLHAWMFPNGETTIDWDGVVSSRDAAKQVFGDLEGGRLVDGQGPLTDLAQAHGAEVVLPPPQKMIDEMGFAAANSFVQKNPGVYYDLDYEDHTTIGSALEHGSAWNSTPHVRTSNH